MRETYRSIAIDHATLARWGRSPETYLVNLALTALEPPTGRSLWTELGIVATGANTRLHLHLFSSARSRVAGDAESRSK